MREVIEVQAERAVALHAHDVAHGVYLRRFAVGREAHDFVLIAVMRKAEKLRYGGVEDPERVWKADFAEDFDLVLRGDAPHRADEVTETVHRQDRSIVERRDKVRGRQVRAVMLDMMQPRLQRFEPERLFQFVFDPRNLQPIGEPLPDRAERRTFGQNEFRALKKARVRIAVDRDVVDVIEIDTRFVEAVADGNRRKSRPMFDPPETFLLCSADELAVDENAGGGVRVVRVDAENDHS